MNSLEPSCAPPGNLRTPAWKIWYTPPYIHLKYFYIFILCYLLYLYHIADHLFLKVYITIYQSEKVYLIPHQSCIHHSLIFYQTGSRNDKSTFWGYTTICWNTIIHPSPLGFSQQLKSYVEKSEGLPVRHSGRCA